MNAPADLWLVRHGASLHHTQERFSWDDAPLTEEGHRQAQRLAERLVSLEAVTALYSSPIRRAVETAHPIAAALGLPITLHPGLRELDFGRAGGLTLAEFRERWPELFSQWQDLANPHFRWPEGESREEFRRRVITALEGLARAHAGERSIVVGHTGSLCCYLAHLLTGDAGRWREFILRPASLSRLRVGPEGGRLLLFDDTSHLEDQ